MGIEKLESQSLPQREHKPFSVVRGGQFHEENNKDNIIVKGDIAQQIEQLKKDIIATAFYEQMKWDGYDIRDIPKEKIPTLLGTLSEKNIQLEQLTAVYNANKNKEGLFYKIKNFFQNK